MVIYIQLFLTYFQIGLFSFGGGYASMPLIQSLIVDTNGWLTMEELTNLITISQMTPGPIAINSATFVGQQVAGFWGGLCATLGCITPSLIIVYIISVLYVKYKELPLLQLILKYLRPIVISMIFVSGINILCNAIVISDLHIWNAVDFKMLTVFCLCFALLILKPKINIIAVMLTSGILYTFLALI